MEKLCSEGLDFEHQLMLNITRQTLALSVRLAGGHAQAVGLPEGGLGAGRPQAVLGIAV